LPNSGQPRSSSSTEPHLPIAPSTDSPPYRSQIEQLSVRLAAIKRAVKDVHKTASKVSELLVLLGEAEHELAGKMDVLGEAMEVSDPLEGEGRSVKGGLRKLWGDQGVVGKRRKERKEERDGLERSVIGPCQDYYEKLKDAEREKLSRKGYEVSFPFQSCSVREGGS
jgi:hypothetical protein